MSGRFPADRFAAWQPGNTEFMTNKDSGTTPSEATRAQEETEAAAPHEADRPPTREEEQVAPQKASSDTERGYKDMAEKGAKVKGEGELP